MDSSQLAANSEGACGLELLLENVYRRTGHDFRGYKQGTITRRLDRRCHFVGAKDYAAYLGFLEANPEEYQRLVAYLTVTVSSFFRSEGTFEQVAGLVLPELISHKRSRQERELKIWSTACAQGEEPYSIAIMLADFLGSQRGDFDSTIYATDINRQVLAEAREGVYSPKDLEHLPATIRDRYFAKDNEGYTLNEAIRQMVRFSYFDLISNEAPPFDSLDLIFCCNVLIYLDRQRQGQVLDMLYHLLNLPGYLVLGEVETPTGLSSTLSCLDKKARIFKKEG
ncbi:CheR family methyltransferase [Chloroflexota bacterium]